MICLQTWLQFVPIHGDHICVTNALNAWAQIWQKPGLTLS